MLINKNKKLKYKNCSDNLELPLCNKEGTKQLWTMMLLSTTFLSSGTPPSVSLRLQQLVSALKPLRSQLAVPLFGKFQSPSAGDFYIAFIPLDWHPPICERSSELYQPKFRFNKTTIVGVFFPIYAAGAMTSALV